MRCFIVIAAGACGFLALFPGQASAQVDAVGNYPVCSAGMQDGCQNPGEGGAPGRSRASDYNGGPAAHAATVGSVPRHHAPRKKTRHHRRR